MLRKRNGLNLLDCVELGSNRWLWSHDHDIVALNFNLVRWFSRLGRRIQNLSCCHFEFTPVPWTGDNFALQCSFIQRSPSVSTRVCDSVNFSVHINEQNLLSCYFRQLHRSGGIITNLTNFLLRQTWQPRIGYHLSAFLRLASSVCR